MTESAERPSLLRSLRLDLESVHNPSTPYKLDLMQLVRVSGLKTVLASMQWRRGLRAGLAVGVAMVVCLLLDHPMGWAALGGLLVVLVDNGGPYRSRFANVLTILLGGSLAVGLGVLAGVNLPTALAVTILFCFAVTLARVLSQPLASASVIILICFIVAYGDPIHTRASGLASTGDFVMGALWAAVLTLILWPVDPFRPARNAVADVYLALYELVHLLTAAVHTPEGNRRVNELLARVRVQIEAAHQAVAATPARMTARTVRAHNLAVLNECADLLLARILRFAELGHNAEPSSPGSGDAMTAYAAPRHLAQITSWLAASIAPIAPALRRRPARGEPAFEPDGRFSVELRRTAAQLEAALARDPVSDPGGHMTDTVRDSQLSIEVAYEAIRAIWSGVELRRNNSASFRESSVGKRIAQEVAPLAWNVWLDTLRANLNLNSVMFRHALRLAFVVAIDVLLIHSIKVTHGYWLVMTSIIVLQPYTGETIRRSGERVLGTVAGSILAALFAASIQSQAGIIAGVTIDAMLAVAFYAVDYAWYCFFITPAIVLMTLPHLRDWHFAAVRMGMTGVGALVAILAMLLLWPERESLQLPGMLARCAAAEAAYLRSTLAFWEATKDKAQDRIAAERSLLAPARRHCGLTTTDAEETLDRALLEHAIPLNPARARTESLNWAALTFTSYLRRLTQSITTLAAIGEASSTNGISLPDLIRGFADRLDAVSRNVQRGETVVPNPPLEVKGALAGANAQLSRMERQVSVLEHAAREIASLRPI
jgi:uncharacterized membrane protein YccC